MNTKSMGTGEKHKLAKKNFELVHKAENIEISYNASCGIMHADWIGIQEEMALKLAGQKVLELVQAKGCQKILNDNTRVIGHWYHSVDWASDNWFPRIVAAGVKHFAWVCSEDVFTQLSAKRAIPLDSNIVRPFVTFDEGYDWLINQV